MATLPTCTSSTRPASPALGDMLYETDTGKTIVCSNATGPVYKVYDSTASPYNLDATNTVSVRPLFHFDAALWNGLDDGDNPSDATTLDENYTWTDRAHGLTTVGQDSAAKQPVYYTSGENSKPYLDCSGADFLKFAVPQCLRGPFTLFGVAKTTAAQKMNFFGKDLTASTEGGTTMWFSWGASVEYIFFGQGGTASGVHPSAGGSTSYATTRCFIIRRDSSDNTSNYVDGDNTVSDGTTWGPATNATAMAITQLLTGGAYGTTGEYYEAAVWASDLSDADRNEIGDYVIAKYGLSFDDF